MTNSINYNREYYLKKTKAKREVIRESKKITKYCIVCGKSFRATNRRLTCSSECSKLNGRRLSKKYQRSDKGKASSRKWHKEYRKTDAWAISRAKTMINILEKKGYKVEFSYEKK